MRPPLAGPCPLPRSPQLTLPGDKAPLSPLMQAPPPPHPCILSTRCNMARSTRAFSQGRTQHSQGGDSGPRPPAVGQ